MICICSGVTGTGHTEVWKQKDIQPPGLTVPLIDLMKTKGFQSQSQCVLRVCMSRVCVWAGPSLYVCVCRLLTTHTVWMNHYHLHIKLLENTPGIGPGPSAGVFL